MKPKTPKNTEPYRNHLVQSLKEDPGEAARYLSACLEDEDPRMFLIALRDVADAYGGVRSLANRTGLNRESLYRMLSGTRGRESSSSCILARTRLGIPTPATTSMGRST